MIQSTKKILIICSLILIGAFDSWPSLSAGNCHSSREKNAKQKPTVEEKHVQAQPTTAEQHSQTEPDDAATKESEYAEALAIAKKPKQQWADEDYNKSLDYFKRLILS